LNKGDYAKCLEHATKVLDALKISPDQQRDKQPFDMLPKFAEINKKILDKNELRIKKCTDFLNRDLKSGYKFEESKLNDTLEWKLKLCNMVSF
jgi:hypothetical protein